MGEHQSAALKDIFLVAQNSSNGRDIIRKNNPKPLFTIEHKDEAVAYAVAFCRNHYCELHVLDSKGKLVEKKEF